LQNSYFPGNNLSFPAIRQRDTNNPMGKFRCLRKSPVPSSSLITDRLGHTDSDKLNHFVLLELFNERYAWTNQFAVLNRQKVIRVAFCTQVDKLSTTMSFPIVIKTG
jgi:hypothetical protein